MISNKGVFGDPEVERTDVRLGELTLMLCNGFRLFETFGPFVGPSWRIIDELIMMT